MLESLEPFGKIIERLVNDFSWRRLIVLLLLVSSLLAAVGSFELLTGYFRLARLEKEIALLGQLQKLQERQKSPNAQLVLLQKDLTSQLVGVVNGPRGYQVNPRILQGLAALAPWLLFSLTLLPDFKRGKQGAGLSLVGLLIFAVPLVAIGALLPPSLGPFWRYIAYPWFPMTILLSLGAVIYIRHVRTLNKNRQAILDHPLATRSSLEVGIRGTEKENELYQNMRAVLDQVSREGLHGDRHVIINFSATCPGVAIPAHLNTEKDSVLLMLFPWNFWSLQVEGELFSGVFEFGKTRDRISVPFSAISSFSVHPDGLEYKILEPPREDRQTQSDQLTPGLQRTATA